MISVNLAYRHPLDETLSGFDPRPNADHLAVVRHPAIFSVMAHAGHEGAVLAALATIADVSVRTCGPAEWVLVSETATADSVSRDLAALRAGQASFVDQSDGRVLLRLSGPNVRKILAKCVAVDLHADVFAEGQSANMLCCHVGCNLGRTGPDSFEILVPRSYIGTVFSELLEMGREFGLSRGFAG
jgi:sarcosine oxidase subunit gamma